MVCCRIGRPDGPKLSDDPESAILGFYAIDDLWRYNGH